MMAVGAQRALVQFLLLVAAVVLVAAIGAGVFRLGELMMSTGDPVAVAKPAPVSLAALAAPVPNSCPLPPFAPATPAMSALRCAVLAVAEQTGQVRQIHGRAVTRAIPYWFDWSGWDPFWDQCAECGTGRLCNLQVVP